MVCLVGILSRTWSLVRRSGINPSIKYEASRRESRVEEYVVVHVFWDNDKMQPASVHSWPNGDNTIFVSLKRLPLPTAILFVHFSTGVPDYKSQISGYL